MSITSYVHRIYPIGTDFLPEQVEGTIDIKVKGNTIPIILSDVFEISEQVLEWDDKDYIRDWFRSQGATESGYTFDIELLEALLEDCKLAQDKIQLFNSDAMVHKAFNMSKLLPVREFEFFLRGYTWSIEETIKHLETVIQEDKHLQELGVYPIYNYVEG